MSEVVYGAIGLTVCLLAIIAMIGGAWADARAQSAHDRWQAEFHEWLAGGMRGPRP